MSELDELFGDIFEEEEKEEKKPKGKVMPIPPARPQEEKEPEDVLVENIVPVAPKEHPEEKAIMQQIETKAQEQKSEQISIKSIKPVALASSEQSDTFDFDEAEPMPKEVILIYGQKGHGKTFLAMSFPGKIVVLSFDRKSALVKYKDYKGDSRIKVYDVTKYMDYSSPTSWLETADKTFRYLNALLDFIEKDPPDWIVIDGTEIFHQICEMTMRYRNNLMPFQGIANLNLWKERRLYIRQIHNKALSVAKRGLIYTTYIAKDEVVIEGELITKKDVPKWIDAIMYETDVVIRVKSIAAADDGARQFIAIVESSKGHLPTGLKADITNSGYKALVSAAKK